MNNFEMSLCNYMFKCCQSVGRQISVCLQFINPNRLDLFHNLTESQERLTHPLAPDRTQMVETEHNSSDCHKRC